MSFPVKFSLCGSDDGVFGLIRCVPPDWKHQMICVNPGVWRTLNMDQFKMAMREAANRGAPIEAPDPKLIDLLVETPKGHTGVDWTTLGSPMLRTSVMPHQVKAVNRVVSELGGRAIVALPTGTGKSLTASAIAARYGGSVLIIASSQDQWIDEIGLWTEYENFVKINGADGDLGGEESTVVCMCTFKSVGLRKDVQDKKWTTVIVDESHKLGGDCATNKAIVDVCKRARCVLMVSATPMKNRPRELFNTLRALLPGIFTNRKKFEARYCDGKQGRFGYEATGATNTEELAALIDYLSVTCDKKAVLPDLPSISFADVRMDMPAAVVKEFQEMQAEYEDLTRRANDAPDHLKKSIKNQRDALSMRMHVRTGQCKVSHCVDWLIEFLNKQEDRTQKVIVFLHHTELMDVTCAALTHAGVGNVKIDGSTPAKKRHAMLHPIRDPNNTSKRVAVLSLGTCAEALNLSPGANIVVMFQMAFTPAQNDQAYARVYRKGATRPVSVYRLIANGTSDDTMLRIHSSKDKTTERLFGKKQKLDDGGEVN